MSTRKSRVSTSNKTNKTKKNTQMAPANGVRILNIRADKRQPAINDELKCIRCNNNKFHAHYGVYAGRIRLVFAPSAGKKYHIFSCTNCHFNMDFRGKIDFKIKYD